MRHNSTALNAFTEVVKVMNHTGLWYAGLTWCFSLEYDLVINTFRSTWPNCGGSCNPSEILAALDALTEIVKVMNHTGLTDAELAWYSLSTSHQIFFYGLEHSFSIHSFRLIWLCLIVEVLATQTKFLEPFGYCIVINCAFNFHTKVFGCFPFLADQILLDCQGSL